MLNLSLTLLSVIKNAQNFFRKILGVHTALFHLTFFVNLLFSFMLRTLVLIVHFLFTESEASFINCFVRVSVVHYKFINNILLIIYFKLRFKLNNLTNQLKISSSNNINFNLNIKWIDKSQNKNSYITWIKKIAKNNSSKPIN